MAALRTTDRIDDLAFDADRTGRHAELAEHLLATAQGMPSGAGALRAEVLVAAAEQLQLCGDVDRAVEAVREAQADGGDVRLGVRTHLVVALDAAGATEQAREVLAEIRQSQPTDLALHLFLGEHCDRSGRPAEANTWLTRALVIAERSNTVDMNVVLLLLARRRVRQRLGFPADDWDERADALGDRAEQAVAAELAAREAERSRRCPCGSGRKARRCRCATAGVTVAVGSVQGDAYVIDLAEV
jgi:uncharacterized protein HemY